jgi:hypothetical protein
MKTVHPFEALTRQLWKESYAFTEAVVSRPLQVALGTETASQLMSLARDTYASGRQTGDEALERTWEQLRLASRGELARVAGLVVQADDRVVDLEERLVDLEGLVRHQADQLTRQESLLVEQASLLRAIQVALVPPAPSSKAKA